tara:strand:+ start:436 stop:582 length:147 start_codon:yes stop_codon:yes gene_type:complete
MMNGSNGPKALSFPAWWTSPSAATPHGRFEPKAPDVARFTSDGFSNEY